jgi:hypothetical protein
VPKKASSDTTELNITLTVGREATWVVGVQDEGRRSPPEWVFYLYLNGNNLVPWILLGRVTSSVDRRLAKVSTELARK